MVTLQSKTTLTTKITNYYYYYHYDTSCSIETASDIMCLILSGDGLLIRFLYMRQAKSQCNPSSLLISSLENVKPGINPLLVILIIIINITNNFSNRFFSQNIAANDPEKNIPSTAANAMILSPKESSLDCIQLIAQSAFFLTQGTS